VPYGERVNAHFRVDPDAPKLIYVQVADHMSSRIGAGELAQGARLPAERDLATQYGCPTTRSTGLPRCYATAG
jgi:DNA-binding GntR family transcriptional regulator